MSNAIFMSMGMFIIDEIHYSDTTASVYDVIGGAGTYGAVGCRLFVPEPESRRIGLIVDEGNDFPDAIRQQILDWNIGSVFRYDGSRQTTRGWNKYGEREERRE